MLHFYQDIHTWVQCAPMSSYGHCFGIFSTEYYVKGILLSLA